MSNLLLIAFLKLLFLESCVLSGGLWRALSPFIRLFYGVHFSIYYQHGRHMEVVTIIESFLGMRQGDPLGGFLFALAHY
jgi:hypothetical protein